MAKSTTEKERIFGLDFVRAMVALFVVFHHLLPISPLPGPMQPLAMLGSLGVELLFVLCGFLLGQSLLKSIDQKRLSTRRDLLQFLSKRWLRILPAYYFFFLVSAALFPPFLGQVLTHWQYLFFVQNVAWQMPSFYFQTWTLAVLEFFYLLFTVAVFFCWKFSGRKLLTFGICLGLFFIVPLLLRAAFAPLLDTASFEATIRRWVIYRLDAPVFGVLMALLMREFPGVWKWLQVRSWIGLTLFAGMVVYHLAGFPLLYSSHWFEVIFYPVVCATFALTLPVLMTWKENHSLFGAAVSYISQRSYSIYVCHVAAIVLVLNLCIYFTHLDLANSLVVYPVCYAFIFLIASFSYRFVELPFVTAGQPLTLVIVERMKSSVALVRTLANQALAALRRGVTQMATSLGLL